MRKMCLRVAGLSPSAVSVLQHVWLLVSSSSSLGARGFLRASVLAKDVLLNNVDVLLNDFAV